MNNGNGKCVVCQRPISGAALCVRCETALTVALGQVAALADELDLTVTRQTAMGVRNGSRSSEKPLPVNLNASEVADNLKATLVGWVRDLEPNLALQPRDDLTAISRWLMCRMDEIRVHKAAGEIHDEITYAIREAWKAIDRPANRSKVRVSACLDVSCDGSLWCRIPAADYVADDPSTHALISCDECEETYAAEQWLHLGRRVLAMLKGVA